MSKLSKKTCSLCGKEKEFTDFYPNEGSADSFDSWCKVCFEKCQTKDDVKKYMWENGREFSKHMWDQAEERATPIVQNVSTYKRASKEKKLELLEKVTVTQIPFVMNLSFKKINNEGKSYEDAVKENLIESEDKEDEKVFSKVFHGWFTRDELDFLEDYMDNLSDTFDIGSGAAQDYAKKMAKASLVHDKLLNEFLDGKCDIEAVNKAAANFDMLAKSANLAPSKRKQTDDKSIGSYSEISLFLETNGYPCTREIKWPLDDVDKTVMEFKHIITAMGLDDM